MKLIEQLKAYQHQKQQSIENNKVINKLKEDDQNKLNQKDTAIFKSEDTQLKLNVENENEQTMLIDTTQIAAAQRESTLNDKDITRPIDNCMDYAKINKLRDNVLKSKQQYLVSTENFIKGLQKIEE